MIDVVNKLDIGTKVICNFDGIKYNGIVKEKYDDHIIVDVEGISDHCYIDKDNEDMIISIVKELDSIDYDRG